MSNSNFIITLRSLRRDIGFTSINIFGLTVGIACFILIALYVESELSYDRHFAKHEQIYRVVDRLIASDGITDRALSSRELSAAWANDYEEVEAFVRFSPLSLNFNEESLVRYQDIDLYWKDIYYADDNVFTIFSHDILAGDPLTALKNPNSIALSESMARAYFGTDDPVGKVLGTEQGVFTVTLVFADLPRNTHLKYNALISHHFVDASFTKTSQNNLWWNIHSYGYVLIPKPLSAERTNQIAREIFNKYMGTLGATLKRERVSYLEPLTDIHLKSVATLDRPRGNMFYIITFGAIGFFVLFVAAFNYMNLATARATKRAKEIGIRQMLGVERSYLIGQFLTESLSLVFIATLLALVLVYFCLHFTPVKQLLGDGLELNLFKRPELLVQIAVFTLLLGIGSGLYPAFYLSSIGPKAAFESNTRSGSGGNVGLFRKVLVFFQFSISVGVIACTFLMARQLQYIQDQPLGLDPRNIVLIALHGGTTIRQIPVIKNELLRNPNVVSVAETFEVPGVSPFTFYSPAIEDNNGVFNSQTITSFTYGVDYLEHLNIKMAAGRGFDPKAISSKTVIVNQTLVDSMGWDEPLGKRIDRGRGTIALVIGVVEDYHFESLYQPIKSMFIEGVDPAQIPAEDPGITMQLSVRTTGKDTANTLAFLKQTLLKFDKNHPFELKLFETALDEQYSTEMRQIKLIGLFAGLCILIAGLGLYGLSAFTTAQRTKEIGIRRILGASKSSLMLMLFKTTFGTLLAASVVGSVSSYLVINDWLTNFSYRVDTNPLIFLVASMATMVVAFTTIALQSYRIIIAKPVDTLAQ